MGQDNLYRSRPCTSTFKPGDLFGDSHVVQYWLPSIEHHDLIQRCQFLTKQSIFPALHSCPEGVKVVYMNHCRPQPVVDIFVAAVTPAKLFQTLLLRFVLRYHSSEDTYLY